MKKSVLYGLAMLLVLCSCSPKDEIIDSEFFEEWGITIPYRDVSKSETYHLLKNLLDYMYKDMMPPLPVWSNYTYTFFPTEFNDSLRNNKEAVALFEKEDCVSVLISTYLTAIKTNQYLAIDVSFAQPVYYEFIKDERYHYLEWILSSEMFLSEMNGTEKVQLMVLALERMKYETLSSLPFSIMISIMLSSNYPPFIEDVQPMLIELNSCRYCVVSNDFNAIPVMGVPYYLPGVDDEASDLIIRYAKQFINENK